MLRNNFYEYGRVTRILMYIIFVILLFMYISKLFNEFVTTNFWESYFGFFNFLLLILLIVKFFWYLFNAKPLTIATSRLGAVFLNINAILLYLLLFVFSIFTIVLFMVKAYYQFELDVNNIQSYKFLNITIIPFSIIRLMGDVLVASTSMDITNVKLCLSKINTYMFVLLLPLLSFSYLFQLYFYNKIQREKAPEGFN